MDLFDSHAHLADDRLSNQLGHIRDECVEREVAGVVVAAARRREWASVLQICSKSPAFHAAIGIHPFFLQDWQGDAARELSTALNTEASLVAVGEIGLDFMAGRDDLPLQIEAFENQLEIAAASNVPVIFHNRKSWSEFFHCLQQLRTPVKGLCHHFSASCEVARQALDNGLYLSFCGPITYPNARRIRAAAKYAPLDRILTETDCPDLASEAHRGEQSMPWHVAEVLAEIARCKNMRIEAVAEVVGVNFRRLFRLD